MNLLSFVGEIFPGSIQPLDGQLKPYKLFAPQSVDGLIFLAGALATWIGFEGVTRWFAMYSSLPRVSIGLALEGVPSIILDNRAGMRAAVSHLIEVHGRRRIAFLGGPTGHPEAEERYQGYVEALTTHGLAVDPDLVLPGNFLPDSGAAAVARLWDERRVSPDAAPDAALDAIAAANDYIGLGALEALRVRGVGVPTEIALVGFDDSEDVRRIIPPFTTVRQPLEEMGRRAVDMLVALLKGEEVPARVELPTALVVRQSCGCLPRLVESVGRIAVEIGASDASQPRSPGELARQREQIVGAMVRAVEKGAAEGDDAGARREWTGRLFDAFLEELGQSGRFLPVLNDLLREVALTPGDVGAWRGAVMTLRAAAQPYLLLADEAERGRIEDLWLQAYALVAEIVRLQEASLAFQAERQLIALYSVGAALITTLDVDQLVRALADGARELGIPGVRLVLYEKAEPGDQESGEQRERLALVCDEHGPVELGDAAVCFQAGQLVPEEMWPRDRRYSYVVEPLQFRDRPLGFAMFEIGPLNGNVYNVLQQELSSALYGALLLRDQQRAEEALAQAYAEIEQKVQERSAELEQEVAERERAQAELLRLQQEVIEAQKQALRELSTPVIPVVEGVIVMPLIGSIDTLRARDILRAMMAGIREHRAEVVILDITGVQIVDSGVASYLNRAIQAAKLKGARTIVTGISEAVAETIVDLGIDWSDVETLSDLQSGLFVALQSLKLELVRR